MGERIPDVSRMVAERLTDDWTQEPGRLTVRRRRAGPVRTRILRIFGVPPTIAVHLDAMGAEVWLLIDGKRTVGEIRDELQKAHPAETDIPHRLGRFFGAMVSRRMVRLR